MLLWIWGFLVFCVSTTVLGLLATVASLVRPRCNATMRLGRLWARCIFAAVGVRARISGHEHATRRLPCVYIANHQSGFDILALLIALPPSARFVAKKSLFRIPFLGWSIAAAGFVPIDRSNRARAMESLEIAAARIAEGLSVVLFAEGTRSRDGRLAGFKRGAFHLALKAGVPVVPVAISGSWERLPPDRVEIRPGTLRLHFCEPIDTIPYREEGLDRLVETVRAKIVQHLEPHEIAEDARVRLAQAR